MKNRKPFRSFFVCVLICALIFSLSACGTKQEDSKSETSTEENANDLSEELSDTEAEPEADLPEYEATLEKQVLYEENDVTITVTGLTYEALGLATQINLELNVANNTASELDFLLYKSAINGYMVGPSTYNLDTDDFRVEPIPAGGSENIAVYWYSDVLESYGISDLALIEIEPALMSEDGMILSDRIFSIPTSISETYEQTYDTSGDVVYENADFRLIAQGVSGNNYGDGTTFSANFYLENNSDQTLDTYTSEETVNGVPAEGLHYLSYSNCDSSAVWPGHKSIQSMLFFPEDLEAGTEEIKTLDMNFTLETPEGEWRAEPTPISIQYSE